MTALNSDTARRELLGLRIGAGIGAGDHIALLVQHRRESAHPDPTDADEMNARWWIGKH